MTLDAVAARAGLSKGGLLYHFPNKDALLRGMIERFAGSLHEPSEGSVASRIATVRLAKLDTLKDADQPTSHSLLAAIAENPTLLEPIRNAHNALWDEIKTRDADPDTALIAWLAVEGLCFFEMFAISPLSARERARTIARLKALAAA